MTAKDKRREKRRRELERLTAEELRDILAGYNPFGGYSAAEIRKHPTGYVESILRWEGYGEGG